MVAAARTRRSARADAAGAATRLSSLLQLDGGAGLLELRLHLLGLVLGRPLLDGLRRLVGDRLGLLQAEAGQLADDLDHLDLLVTRGGEHDVEGVLLLLAAATLAAAASRSAGRDHDRG